MALVLESYHMSVLSKVLGNFHNWRSTLAPLIWPWRYS